VTTQQNGTPTSVLARAGRTRDHSNTTGIYHLSTTQHETVTKRLSYMDVTYDTHTDTRLQTDARARTRAPRQTHTTRGDTERARQRPFVHLARETLLRRDMTLPGRGNSQARGPRVGLGRCLADTASPCPRPPTASGMRGPGADYCNVVGWNAT